MIAQSRRLRFALRYVGRHRYSMLAGLVALLARDGIGSLIPLLIRQAVTLLAAGKTAQGAWVALAMLAAALPKAGLQAFARLRMMNVSRDVEYDMRNDLFRHLVSLDPGFYSRTRIGDVMAHATNDLNSVRMMMGPGIVNLCDSLVMFPVAFTVMATVNWRLTLVALVPAPLAAITISAFGIEIRRRYEAIQAEFSLMSAAVQQHVAGVRAVRAFAQEKAEEQRFSRISRKYAESNRRLGVYTSLNDPILGFLMGLSSLAVLWLGGREVAASRMSLGSFAMFMTYMGMLLRPVAAIGRVAVMLQRGAASLDRLSTLFGVQSAIQPPDQPRPLALAGGCDLRLERVTVGFNGCRVLDAIDLSIPSGACVAIVGRTGSGKTTLARLIPRLLDPANGRVLVGGVNVRDLAPEDLRRVVGFVPQETFLFSATLAENIALGVPNATRREIHHAAEIAGLGPDISAFPNGFDTMVGERGILLSGGQKQRVAIARALVKNPSILVFDDALSSVDSITENRILDHLDTALEGRTTILITHRLSTIRRAGQILVLERGKVAEAGSHQELIAAGGRYANLWREQLLEQELKTA